MKVDYDFFHVRKLGDDQKKIYTENRKVLVPEVKWRPKKRFSPKIEAFLSPKSLEDKKRPNIIQRSDADDSQIIGGNADVDHSKIIGGDAVKLLGGYISLPFPWMPIFVEHWGV